MLSFRPGTRIFISTEATDMRKGFDGLSAIVEHRWGTSPLSGDLFVFSNRRQTLLKLLYWDTDGYAIWYKRLECGTFRIPRPTPEGRIELLVSIAIGKFLYHLPHYRQVTKTLKDAGISLSKQTVWDWTRKTAELLEPLWELMHQRLLMLDHLAADASRPASCSGCDYSLSRNNIESCRNRKSARRSPIR